MKCVNGTFVGRKTENVIAYKGIPFTCRPPVGELRWKAPSEYLPDEGNMRLVVICGLKIGAVVFHDDLAAGACPACSDENVKPISSARLKPT